MTQHTTIHWFRQDLRLTDNPALYDAAQQGKVLPVYILDDINAGEYAMGAASRWWLHHSLTQLNKSLRGKLAVYVGDPKKILPKLATVHDAHAVYWNRCYEPWQIKRDKEIEALLNQKGFETKSVNASLLWEPWETLKADGTPYKVFTPFYNRGCLKAMPPRKPLRAPTTLTLVQNKEKSLTIAALKLLPKISWDKSIAARWQVGEEAAQKRLKAFLTTGIKHYKVGRDFPAKDNVSRLSPHLHFGEISPNQVWYAAKKQGGGKDVATFLSELGWREFSYSLLYHFPTLPKKNFQPKFNAFPWRKNKKALTRWQQGQTGYPLVDAGMRELWQTGYMHNRVRMIVASFLIKNLRLHWHEGEAWFWDCLIDADLASNSASWQWVAGSGADAAPYFRIFNPVTQGKKFDPDGEYTLQYVPELSKLPKKYLFSPWEAPEAVLKEAGVVLGKTYPKPLVDVAESRQQALAAYTVIK